MTPVPQNSKKIIAGQNAIIVDLVVVNISKAPNFILKFILKYSI